MNKLFRTAFSVITFNCWFLLSLLLQFLSRLNSTIFFFVAFAFFADPEMQSFYRRYRQIFLLGIYFIIYLLLWVRFVRDYMRYKDDIQCAGAELLALVREDALRTDPQGGGDFYALHIRRGDLQFKVDTRGTIISAFARLHL